MAALGIAQKQRDQARLPVMRVNDVGVQLGQAQRLDHALAEKNKPVVVVLVITLARTVGPAAVKELLAADEINREIFLRREHPHVTRVENIAHFDAQVQPPLRARRQLMLQHRAIARQKHGNFVVVPGQRRCHRSHDIGQPARLYIGEHLAGRMNDFHRSKVSRVVG